MSIELCGKRLSERRASILNDAGRARAIDGLRLADGHGRDRLEIGFASTSRATESDTRPNTRVSRAGGLVGVVGGNAHQHAAVRLLDARARQIGQRGADVVGERALEDACGCPLFRNSSP